MCLLAPREAWRRLQRLQRLLGEANDRCHRLALRAGWMWAEIAALNRELRELRALVAGEKAFSNALLDGAQPKQAGKQAVRAYDEVEAFEWSARGGWHERLNAWLDTQRPGTPAERSHRPPPGGSVRVSEVERDSEAPTTSSPGPFTDDKAEV
jgi:hypothetical protein